MYLVYSIIYVYIGLGFVLVRVVSDFTRENIAVCGRTISVSYTHLDVYKRQTQQK